MERNHNYKGGSIASNGYKIIFVGKAHHLADVRGYAYEHRVVAEQKFGRRLAPKEQVHHKDENKLNNHPDNLEIVKSFKEHRFLHRKKDSRLRNPDEENISIKCKCGCGESFLKYDSSGRPREYVTGHNTEADGVHNDIAIWINEATTISQISEKWGITNGTAKMLLGRLVKDGKIERIGHGVYAKKGTPKIKVNVDVLCLCGCGQKFAKYDSGGRERKYISGHNRSEKWKTVR